MQSRTKGWGQIDETKRNRFFYGMFHSWFLARFYQKRQNLAFGWSAEYLPANPSISEIFLKFPNTLSLKSFGDSSDFGNSYIHFLVIKSSSVLRVVKRNCGKMLKSLYMFCSRLYISYPKIAKTIHFYD